MSRLLKSCAAGMILVLALSLAPAALAGQGRPQAPQAAGFGPQALAAVAWQWLVGRWSQAIGSTNPVWSRQGERSRKAGSGLESGEPRGNAQPEAGLPPGAARPLAKDGCVPDPFGCPKAYQAPGTASAARDWRRPQQ